jgi:hypothetical protein
VRQPYTEDGDVSEALAYPDRGAYLETWEDDVCDRLGTAQSARMWADSLMRPQRTEGS